MHSLSGRKTGNGTKLNISIPRNDRFPPDTLYNLYPVALICSKVADLYQITEIFRIAYKWIFLLSLTFVFIDFFTINVVFFSLKKNQLISQLM